MNRTQAAVQRFTLAAAVVGILTMLAGPTLAMAIAFFEAAHWLQTDEWPRWFTAFVVENAPRDFVDWLAAPSSWLGLHRIAVWFVSLPLSGTVALVGIALGGAITAIASSAAAEAWDKVDSALNSR